MNIFNIYIGTAVQNAFLFGGHLEKTWKIKKKIVYNHMGYQIIGNFKLKKEIWYWFLKVKVNDKMAAEKLIAFAVLKNIKIKQIHKFEIGTQ